MLLLWPVFQQDHLWSEWFSRRAWISCAASIKSALSKALREYRTTGQRSADWVYTSSGCHTGLILWKDLYAEGKVSSLNEVIVDLNEFQSYINAPCLQISLLRTTEIWNLKGKDWHASICVINNGLTAAFKVVLLLVLLDASVLMLTPRAEPAPHPLH